MRGYLWRGCHAGYLHAACRFSAQQRTIEAAEPIRPPTIEAQLNLTPVQEQTILAVLDDYAKYYQNIEEEREDVAEHGKRRILAVSR